MTVPSRSSSTDEYIIAIDFDAVTEINGAQIISYHVQIDDGDGGDYTEIKGELADDLELSAQKLT